MSRLQGELSRIGAGSTVDRAPMRLSSPMHRYFGRVLVGIRIDDFAAAFGDELCQRDNGDIVANEPDGPIGKGNVCTAGMETVDIALKVVAVHGAGAAAKVSFSGGVGPC